MTSVAKIVAMVGQDARVLVAAVTQADATRTFLAVSVTIEDYEIHWRAHNVTTTAGGFSMRTYVYQR